MFASQKAKQRLAPSSEKRATGSCEGSFKALGFRGLGFRGLGVQGLGFRV